MRHITGIYNGTMVELLEPLDLPPGTVVEVILLETVVHADVRLSDDTAIDLAILADLYGRGIVASPVPPSGTIDPRWQPIANSGRPISQDILEDRR